METQSPPEETAQVSSDGAEKQEAAKPQTEQNIKSSEGEPKSRLEKRIENLQGKLEGAKSEEDKKRISALIQRLTERLKAQGSFSPYPIKKEPLLTEADIESGVDPQELERRQQLREMALKEEIKQEMAAQQQYVSAIQEHLNDYEKVVAENPELDPKSEKYDQELADFVAKQYFLANTVIDPVSGREQIVPTVKTSEIVAQIKRILEKKTTQAQTEVAGKIRSSAEQSAIPPSAVRETPTPDIEELRKMVWKDPRKVIKTLKEKLKYSEE